MKKSYRFILFIILSGIIMTFFVSKELQNDTFFTIETGNYILENGIDDVEPFTFNENLTFTKLRWGFDILIAFLYNKFGFDAIFCFVLFFAFILGCSLFYVCTKISHSEILSFLVVILATFSFTFFLSARAQIISYVIFTWEFYFLYKLIATNKILYSFLLVILSFILLTFHSSVWIVYYVMFLPYFAEFITKKILKGSFNRFNKNIISRDINIKLLIGTFVTVLITGFLTPLKLSPFLYPYKEISSVAKNIIIELFYTELSIYTVSFIFVIVSTLAIMKHTKVTLSNLFYAIGMIIFSFIAFRNVPIAFIIVAPIFCETIIGFINQYNLWNKCHSFKELIKKHRVVFGYLCFIYIIFILSIAMINHSKKYYTNDSYPIFASTFINQNLDSTNIKLFNELTYGSYLEFCKIKPFIDSRTEIYLPSFSKDCHILEEYVELCNSSKSEEEFKPVWDKMIQKYKFTHVICKKNLPWGSYFKNINDAKSIYEDDTFIIYALNDI